MGPKQPDRSLAAAPMNNPITIYRASGLREAKWFFEPTVLIWEYGAPRLQVQSVAFVGQRYAWCESNNRAFLQLSV